MPDTFVSGTTKAPCLNIKTVFPRYGDPYTGKATSVSRLQLSGFRFCGILIILVLIMLTNYLKFELNSFSFIQYNSPYKVLKKIGSSVC